MKQHLISIFLLLMLPLAATLAASSSAKPEGQNQSQTNPGWYVRLTVATPGERMRDPANLLGQHPYSADGLDQHDLPELLPPFPRYLTLVFPHDDWDAEFDYYASDFHAVDPSQVDQWLFEVRSDDPQRNLLLSWSEVQAIEGEEKSRGKGAPFLDPATLIGRMWLEDVDTGTRIPVADEATKKRYAFNMNGKKIRTFRWVLEDGKGRAPVRRGHKPASWSDTPAANAPGQPPLPQIPPGLAR